MRIGIGAVLNPTGGPARYVIELVRGLGELDGDERYVVFTNRPGDFAAAGSVEIVEVPLRSAVLEPLWDHVSVPVAARRHRIDLYHGIKGAVPLGLSRPCVVTIHDLAIYACPETFAWQQHLHMRPHLRLAARRAVRVIADSQHARRDIASRLGLPSERVVAVPLGVRGDLFHATPGAEDDTVARNLRLPPRFFLYSGTIQPRKNVETIVRAHARLGSPQDWPLVIAGRRRPDYDPTWLRQPPPGIVPLGTVSDAELAVVYRRAGVLVSPSSYEGFGLTFLEAMASGCPVIGTAVTSLPEVVGDAGILLETPSEEGVAAAMRRVSQDESLRADLSARGRTRAARFTWTETARQTRDVYREALQHG